MLKKLIALAGCLLPGMALAAHLQVHVVPPNNFTTPDVASAMGWTTPALHADFTHTMPSGWLDCGTGDGQDHTFYQQTVSGQNDMPPCSRITQMTDPDTGSMALRIRWTSGDTASDGLTVISTQSWDKSRGTYFPNAYYQVITRNVSAPAFDTSTGWRLAGGSFVGHFLWMDPSGDDPLEMDNMENHGDFPWSPDGSLMVNWHWDPSCAGGHCRYHGPGWSPSQAEDWQPTSYHKIGMLVTGDGNNRAACSFIDDQFRGCTTGDADFGQTTQREFLTFWNGVGCSYQQGNTDCTNATITNVYNCEGRICITVPGQGANGGMREPANGPFSAISGVTGVSGVNGVWVVDPHNGGSNDTEWILRGSSWPGGSYGGGGVFNPFTSIDTWVKDVAVMSCSTWQSSMCNTALQLSDPRQ